MKSHFDYNMQLFAYFITVFRIKGYPNKVKLTKGGGKLATGSPKRERLSRRELSREQ
jgi:hypothetical protein